MVEELFSDLLVVVGVFSSIVADASDLETIVFPVTDCESLVVFGSGDTCLVGAGFSEVVVVGAAVSTVGGVVESSFSLELTALGEVLPVFSTLVPALATVEEVTASVACSSTKAAVASSAFTS
ncbi:hypothetical protein [Streptococcus constellatus]|uniref:hypothetical protein n=1 Tax=Streptococcus constellatus TaxID=76860 RepID=UPI00210596E2|nr:hypothetical protein [Streptococcus constellatus]